MQMNFCVLYYFMRKKKSLFYNLSVIFSQQWGLHMTCISTGRKWNQGRKSEQYLIHLSNSFKWILEEIRTVMTCYTYRSCMKLMDASTVISVESQGDTVSTSKQAKNNNL